MILAYAASLSSLVSIFESLIIAFNVSSSCTFEDSNVHAAMTTGPAKGPRPASSTPVTYRCPLFQYRISWAFNFGSAAAASSSGGLLCFDFFPDFVVDAVLAALETAFIEMPSFLSNLGDRRRSVSSRGGGNSCLVILSTVIFRDPQTTHFTPG